MVAPLFTVRVIRRADGALHPVFLRDGVPLILPNLWGEQLSTSQAFNTVRTYLCDLLLLYRWAKSVEVNINQRIDNFQGFTRSELRAFANYLTKQKNGSPAATTSNQRRLHSIRRFIIFAIELKSDLPPFHYETQQKYLRLIDRTTNKLKKMITGRPFIESIRPESKALSATALTLISRAIHPSAATNPFRHQEIKFRNYCLFHTAIETWGRRGELALIELPDLDLSSTPSITFKQPTANNRNKRKDGASLKTKSRQFPISLELRNILILYIERERPKLLRDGVPTLALFVSKKDGRRLSSGTLNTIFKTISKIPELAESGIYLHPHGARASGATEYRNSMMNNHDTRADDIIDTLTYLGGWSQNSQMVARYTKSFVRRLASRTFIQGTDK